MNIHYTCSTADFYKYRDDYFFIRKLLLDGGHVLTRDWLPHTEEKINSGQTERIDIKEIYKKNINAIDNADLVIIEDTVSNFSTGHQITIALQKKKPTLVLWQGVKYRKFKQMFIHGIESDILQVTEYVREDLSDIIEIFISKYRNISDINRFHLVLSGVERTYLDWAQMYKGKSRTQIIKDSLQKEINSDTDYEVYLLKGKDQ